MHAPETLLFALLGQRHRSISSFCVQRYTDVTFETVVRQQTTCFYFLLDKKCLWRRRRGGGGGWRGEARVRRRSKHGATIGNVSLHSPSFPQSPSLSSHCSSRLSPCHFNGLGLRLQELTDLLAHSFGDVERLITLSTIPLGMFFFVVCVFVFVLSNNF